MTNPADELRQAAQTLMDLADVAQTDLDTDDYWKPYDKATAWRDGFVNGFGGVCSDLVAVFTPAVAHALAAVLRLEADVVAARTAEDGTDEYAVDLRGDHLLDIARQINAAA